MKNRVLKIIIWNIFIVLFLALLFEIIVRILYPQIQLSGLDRKILEPNVYNSTVGLAKNNAGTSNGILKQVDSTRCWKYLEVYKKVKRKILILGDSATMGIGVGNDSTFIGILNYNLRNVKFFNVALIGYSIEDYLNIIESLIQKKKNELGITDIFIFWCLNDVYSNFPDLESPAQKNKLAEIISDFLVKNSKLYHLLKNIFTDRPQDYFFYDRKFYREEDLQLKNSIKKLERISKIANTENISVYLFLLPYEYQIRCHSMPDIFEPQKIIIENLRNLNIVTTDCSVAFIKSKLQSNQLYLYGDGIHFSDNGHKILANYILNSFTNFNLSDYNTN